MSKNVSNNFKNAIKAGGPFYSYATVTLKDGTELTYTSEKDFSISGTEYSEGTDSGFPFGLAMSKMTTLILNNTDAQNKYDYYYARIALFTEADMPDGTVERVQEGIFTVIDSVAPGETLEITAYDDMYKADVKFTSTLTYPVSAQMLLNEVCDKCDINLGSASFKNNNFQIQQAPNGLTGRQVIGYIAQIAGGNAVIDRTGHLIIKSYDFSGFDVDVDVSYGEIESESGIHIISEYATEPDISTDDVTITGVSVTIESEDSESEDENYVAGDEEYVVSIDNPLIKGQEKVAADLIADSVVGITIRPFNGEFFPNPTIEFMDLAYVVDSNENVYKTFITSHDFTYLGMSSLSCGVESPERHGGSYYSTASDVYQKAKNEIKKNKTQWEQAIEDLANRVGISSGLYTTEEKQEDGSTIFYLHNKATLEESDIIWKMTAETLTVSTDGGGTWNAGITVDGQVIARIMNTIGINFDWGVGGTLIIQDANGHQTAYIDAETGDVRLSVQSLTITGKTVQDIASEQSDAAINDFIDAVYDPALANLQAQIDGQIETYYYDYEPALSNAPASDWTTEDERAKHEGDLFYWKSKGYAYRFFKDGSTWKWQMVQDTDITSALKQAAEAKDTADQKRRVFISTPTPPYDVGDLWTQGDNGDIMRCQTARQSGNYNSSDWVKASKYTDDSYAEEVKQDLQNQINNINNLILQLSNEIISVATNYNGLNGEYSECYTNAYLYIGNDDITNDTSVVWTATASSGVSGSWSEELKRYTVTNMTGDNGSVDITASYNGITVTKTFSISKSKAGAPGVEGPPGDDGRTLYTWIKYADSPTSGMSDYPTNKKYMGIAYNKISPDKSTNYSDYAWSLIEGEGVAGPPGKDGETLYTWIKYATSADGDNMTDSPESRTYIGFAYNKKSPIESTNPNDYTWSLIQGEPGRVYMLQASVQVMVLGYDNVFSPPSVTFSSYYRNGGDAERSEYSGRFVIKEVSDNGVYQTKYTSSRDETSVTYVPSGTNVKNIQCTLYTSGGTSKSLDVQSVAVAKDVDNISQQEMFNILTNNGEIAGIFMQNGKLYINASYVKSGVLDTDVLDVDDIFSKNVKATGTISGATITGASGEFTKYFKVNIENGSIIVQQNITPEGLAIGVMPKNQAIQEFINAIYLFETGIDITSDNNILLSSNGNIDIQSRGDLTLSSFGGTVYIDGTSYSPVTVNPGCFNKCGHVATVNAWGDAALGIIRTLDASWCPAYGNAVASGWCYNTRNRIYYPCVCKWDTSGNPTAYAIATFGEANNNYVIYQSGTDRRSTYTLFITGTWIVN